MENKYYIYLHIKATNGEPFYVGKGCANRAYSKTSRNKFWNHIVNKYNYEVLILENNLIKEDALTKEKYWINRIGRRDLKNGPLVNMTDGGDGSTGVKFSEEAKIKLKNAHLGRKYSEEINKKKGRKGVEKSKEHKLNISKSLIGKKHSDERKQNISNARKEKNLIGNYKEIIHLETGIFYNTIKEAALTFNINRVTLAWQIKNNKNKNFKTI